ncbi:hypothetical protein DSM112329_05340 [Paraconexibacter sp. AEG42_29]|uniref:cellulase n=1 Tax=Paraconexibacter sp. AEG42_29 TaxID=2997339 RepID=A0AAU7B3A1_9ACTN
MGKRGAIAALVVSGLFGAAAGLPPAALAGPVASPRSAAAVLSAHGAAAGSRTAPRAAAPVAGGRPGAVVVRGNKLIDTSTGLPMRLLGVNRGALGDACNYGGVSDGPIHDETIDAMIRWHITAVRLPINQDCWLGIHGRPRGIMTAAEYRTIVVDYARALEAKGLVVILDNQYGSVPIPGTGADYIPPLPDGNVVPFLTSLAETFRDDDDVIIDLYNEPHPESGDGVIVSGGPAEKCWRDGCVRTWTGGPELVSYDAVGMQQMVDAVRSTGARQPLIVGGLNYAGDLSAWLQYRPVDPAGQLIAATHLYQCVAGTSLGNEGTKGCPEDSAGKAAATARVKAWDTYLAPVAAQVPLVAAEVGEYDCGHDFSDQFFDWADAHGVGYLGWTWNATDTGPAVAGGFGGDGVDDGFWFCDGRHDLRHGGPALISNYDGTPTPFGVGLKNRLQRFATGPKPLIEVAVPAEGQRVPMGTTLATDVTCRPDTGGAAVIATCAAPKTVDTSRLGPAELTVSALDAAGQASTKVVRYVVDDPPPPPPVIPTQATTATVPATTVPATTATTPTRTPVVLPVISLAGVPRGLTASAAGTVGLRLRCLGTIACRGTLRLSTPRPARVAGTRPRTASTLATGTYALPAGRSLTVKLRLTRTARARVKAAARGLKAVLTVTPRVAAARPRTAQLTLRPAAARPTVRRPAAGRSR